MTQAVAGNSTSARAAQALTDLNAEADAQRAMASKASRRGVLGAMLALPVVAGVTVLKDERLIPHRTARDYIEQIAWMHPNGREVALHAYRVDAAWDRIKEIRLEGPNAPVLRFGQRPGSRGYPNAEIMASMAGVFLHGPVEAF